MIYSNTSRFKTVTDFVNGIKIFVVLVLLVFFFSSGTQVCEWHITQLGILL